MRKNLIRDLVVALTAVLTLTAAFVILHPDSGPPHRPTSTMRLDPPTTAAAPELVSAGCGKTVPATLSPGQQRVVATIRAVWPDEFEGTALRIAYRESSLLPVVRDHRNRNGTLDRGSFQINSIHWRYARAHGYWPLSDPGTNVRFALDLYHRSHNSFRPWGCS